MTDTSAALTDAQLADLRQQWAKLGLDVRPLPTGYMERQRELLRRKQNRDALIRFIKDLHKISMRAASRGLLMCEETDAITAVIINAGARIQLERSILEATRK